LHSKVSFLRLRSRHWSLREEIAKYEFSIILALQTDQAILLPPTDVTNPSAHGETH
jgi:hypothetical protein